MEETIITLTELVPFVVSLARLFYINGSDSILSMATACLLGRPTHIFLYNICYIHF